MKTMQLEQTTRSWIVKQLEKYTNTCSNHISAKCRLHQTYFQFVAFEMISAAMPLLGNLCISVTQLPNNEDRGIIIKEEQLELSNLLNNYTDLITKDHMSYKVLKIQQNHTHCSNFIKEVMLSSLMRKARVIILTYELSSHYMQGTCTPMF